MQIYDYEKEHEKNYTVHLHPASWVGLYADPE